MCAIFCSTSDHVPRPWRLRSAELRLLLIALIFFAAGYTLVALAVDTGEPISSPTLRGIARILWPSVLPFLLFLAMSLGLSWRLPSADH